MLMSVASGATAQRVCVVRGGRCPDYRCPDYRGPDYRGDDGAVAIAVLSTVAVGDVVAARDHVRQPGVWLDAGVDDGDALTRSAGQAPDRLAVGEVLPARVDTTGAAEKSFEQVSCCRVG